MMAERAERAKPPAGLQSGYKERRSGRLGRPNTREGVLKRLGLEGITEITPEIKARLTPKELQAVKLAIRSRHERENRQYYLANGKCPRCGGARPVVPGKTLCEVCLENNRRRTRTRHAKAQSLGLCAVCEKRLPEPGFTTCHYCKELRRRYMVARYHKKHPDAEYRLDKNPNASRNRLPAVYGADGCRIYPKVPLEVHPEVLENALYVPKNARRTPHVRRHATKIHPTA